MDTGGVHPWVGSGRVGSVKSEPCPTLRYGSHYAERVGYAVMKALKGVEWLTCIQVIAGDEVIANQAAASAQGMKEECQNDLAEAIPALEAAIHALDTLKPADITEVKSMKVGTG